MTEQYKELEAAILSRLQLVHDVISSQVEDLDIEGLVGKLNKLVQITSTATACIADAKELLGLANLEALKGVDMKGITASVFNRLVDSGCVHEEALLGKAEGLAGDVRSSIKGIVTIISLYKEEASLNLRTPTNVFKVKNGNT